MTIALALLGLGAGTLTTVAGQGGGLVLLLACAALVGPRSALAITAPALLLGNLHRALLFRRDIDRSVALRTVAGAVPGAFAGGLLAGTLPEWTLRVLLVGLTALSIARAMHLLAFDVPRWSLGPAGFVIGCMTGTAGGAGILFAPVLLSAGLHGRAFVGTIATVAFATHAGRVVAYATNGVFGRELLLPILVVSASIALGNALGERLRARLSSTTTTRLEYGVLVLCAALSVGGIA